MSTKGGPAMGDLSTLALPVLPLRNGIVFPNMVVTVSIESDEAKRAMVAAAKVAMHMGGVIIDNMPK